MSRHRHHPDRNKVKQANRRLENALANVREVYADLRDDVLADVSPPDSRTMAGIIAQMFTTCGDVIRELISPGECPLGGTHNLKFTEVVNERWRCVCEKCGTHITVQPGNAVMTEYLNGNDQ